MAWLRWVALFLCASGVGSSAQTRDNLARAHGRVLPRPNTVFVLDGVTTRDEVLKALGAFDTSASTADFFWARWTRFRAPAGRHDSPTVENLVVAFDPDGIAAASGLHSDPELLPVLWRRVDRIPSGAVESFVVPAWCWSALRYLKGTPQRGDLTVSTASAGFLASGHKPPGIEFPLSALERMESEDYATEDRMHLSLYFRDGSNRKRLKLDIAPVEVIWLIGFVKAAGVSTLAR